MMQCCSVHHCKKEWFAYTTDDVSRELAGLFFLGYAVLQLAAPLLCAR